MRAVYTAAGMSQRSDLKRLRKFGWGVIAGCLTMVPLSKAAFPNYVNQASPTSCYDSGICTSTGVVWDNTFASWVQTDRGYAGNKCRRMNAE